VGRIGCQCSPSPLAGRHWVSGFLLICLISGGWLSQTQAGAWQGYGRSLPRPRYEQDDGARANYRFGVNKAFTPYQDPPLAEAASLPNPLLESRFDSYRLIVIVNKKTDPFWGRAQTLRVYQRGQGLIYYWLISTGARGFETPSGYFRPQGFSSRHWSGPYDAPMLWSVFFNGDISLHSSLDRDALRNMGRAAASHGCVRIEDHRAEELYHLIGHSGFGLVDQLDRRTGTPVMKARQQRKVQAYKTLIIVAPTRRWTDTSSARQETVPTMPARPNPAVKPIGAIPASRWSRPAGPRNTEQPAPNAKNAKNATPAMRASPGPKTGETRMSTRDATSAKPAPSVPRKRSPETDKKKLGPSRRVR
jgi:lipoprotein-anchoring transpeptidase ErfK/SrfK